MTSTFRLPGITSGFTALSRFVRTRLRRRAARHALETRLDARGPVPDHHFAAIVYFSDGPVNLYQIRQWYGPMEVLARTHPVAVVARDPETALTLLDECPIPVVVCRNIAELESWLAQQQVTAFFYVNQNRSNFSAIRFAAPAHVFVSHGESDKIYMASNQLKAYDATMVAGQAAVDRIERHLVDFDTTKLVRIGRPQVDFTEAGPSLPDDGRTVVLYAPTWEGDRPSMSYSSVASHGPALVAALVATGRHRVVFRPHPRTGVFDASYRPALERISAILREANAADPGARHLDDRDTPFGWHLTSADVAITDVSAVAFDWLATGKPILLTEPVAPDVELDRTGIAGALPLLYAAEAGAVVQRLDALATAPDDARRALVEHYFGDVTPGASLRRFVGAASQIIEQRAAALDARASTTADLAVLGGAPGVDGRR